MSSGIEDCPVDCIGRVKQTKKLVTGGGKGIRGSHVAVMVECQMDGSITRADSKRNGVMTIVDGLLVVTQLKDFPIAVRFCSGFIFFVVGDDRRTVGTEP